MRVIVATMAFAICCCLSAAAQNAADLVASKALQATAEECEDVTSMSACHASYAAGCSLPKDGQYDENFRPGYDAYLAYFKNQIPTVRPRSQGMLKLADFVRLYRSTPETISANNHAAFSAQLLKLGEGQYFTVIGYLYYHLVNKTGEACNCALKSNEEASDYHIGIGFDPQLAKQVATVTATELERSGAKPQLEKTSIIVEMTPHYRAKYHPKWTSDSLERIRGRQVKVVGQLLLDNDHMKKTDICSTPPQASDGPKCWRASPWELHPVTEFYVCRADNCAPDSSDWVALDDFQPASAGAPPDGGTSAAGTSHRRPHR